MKIVIVSIWFSEKMGYIENCLPKALAQLGHEVHVVSSTAQVYYDDPNYNKIYEPYLGKKFLEQGTKEVDGFTLHRLPIGLFCGKIYIKQLKRKLKKINPDVVQVFDAFSFPTFQGALLKLFLDYKFFTANHTVASVFPLYHNKKNNFIFKFVFYFTRTLPGRLISLATSRCYPATIDALDIAVKYYGIPKNKTKLACLGVDTHIFKPFDYIDDNQTIKQRKRKKLGFNENDIVCIYTGRFTEGKSPLLLAQAIEKLVEAGEPFRGFFMGNGPQANLIQSKKGCFCHEFVPYHQLPEFYAIADIGVWPKQESTSMLDATACGLPIVISNKVLATERVEGNGLTYIENDANDLARTLLKLKFPEIRKKLGNTGVEKIKKHFSWEKIAKERVADYEKFI